MKNRDNLVPEWDREKRCSLCYCGHVHTYGAHYKAIREHKQAEARRDGHWLCLCARVHPPEIEWCPGCLCKRHQGADILATVVDGVLDEGGA